MEGLCRRARRQVLQMLGRPSSFWSVSDGILKCGRIKGIGIRDWAFASWLRACSSLRFMTFGMEWNGEGRGWEERSLLQEDDMLYSHVTETFLARQAFLDSSALRFLSPQHHSGRSVEFAIRFLLPHASFSTLCALHFQARGRLGFAERLVIARTSTNAMLKRPPTGTIALRSFCDAHYANLLSGHVRSMQIRKRLCRYLILATSLTFMRREDVKQHSTRRCVSKMGKHPPQFVNSP